MSLPTWDGSGPDNGLAVDVAAVYANVNPNDGIDDTAGIQQAINDFAGDNRILYFADGTYDVSDTLLVSSDDFGFTTLQGQSTDGTVFRLVDNSAGFGAGDPAGKAVVEFEGRNSADVFQNEFHNFTIDTGVGNTTATGLKFWSNNQGGVFDVKIVSGDAQGRGTAGLDLGGALNGPLLVQGLEVTGFDYGVDAGGGANNSLTLEDVTVTNQKVAGVLVVQQVVSIRDLNSSQELDISAVVNGTNDAAAQHWFGTLTLVDSSLEYTGSGTGEVAVNALGNLFAQDIEINGYDNAVFERFARHRPEADRFVALEGQGIETFYHSALRGDTSLLEQTLFNDTPLRTLDLPVKDAPDVPLGDVADWVNVADFIDDDDATDDTAGVQAAIDSFKAGGVNEGKHTLYIPSGLRVRLGGLVDVSGPVQRIIGLKGRIVGANQTGGFRILDGGPDDAEVVKIERLSGFGGAGNNFVIEHASSRTVSVVNTTGISVIGSGTGDFFLDDTVGGNYEFRGEGQNIWARQFDVENPGTKVVNDGSNLWVLGIKTEQFGTVIDTINGGKTEVLGGLIFRVDPASEDDAPIFSVTDATATFAGVGEYNPGGGRFYDNLIEETRDGVTETLTRSDVTSAGRHNGSRVLYIASTGTDFTRTVAEQDFDTPAAAAGFGWSGDWATTGDANFSEQFGTDGGARLRLRGDAVATRSIDLTATQGDIRLEVDLGSNSFQSGDTLTVAANDGSGWDTLLELTSSTGTILSYDLDLSGYAGASDLELSFDLDGTAGLTRVTVDNLTVRANGGVLAFQDFSAIEQQGIGWASDWSFFDKGVTYRDTEGVDGSGAMLLRDETSATRRVDLSGLDAATLEFSYKLDPLAESRSASVQVNDGTGWTTLELWDADDVSDDFRSVSLDLSGFNLTEDFQVRFDLAGADHDEVHEKLWIDDLSIVG
ncbi:MAG: glycosyl hydrolase family 28-related protein [Planctomycetota bacterium]